MMHATRMTKAVRMAQLMKSLRALVRNSRVSMHGDQAERQGQWQAQQIMEDSIL